MNQQDAKLVVIGASAGALDALSAILPLLPATLSLPILAVVHIPPDRESALAELMAARCAMRVKEAEDKEPLSPGTIYFAPPDYHLLVESTGVMSLSSDEQVLYSRPSINVLFESAADSYGSAVIGIVLTGANPDGSEGLRAIVDAGGLAVVQNPSTAFAPQMPDAAITRCPEAKVMSLHEISEFIQKAAL